VPSVATTSFVFILNLVLTYKSILRCIVVGNVNYLRHSDFCRFYQTSRKLYVVEDKVGNYVFFFISVINQLDAQNFCFTISLFHASTRFEHMCSKHVEA